MVTEEMGEQRSYSKETGLNLHISRSRGRAAVDERASSRVVCDQRGRNMPVIMAIRSVCYELMWGGVTADVFGDFLTKLGAVLEDEPATVIVDEVPGHRGGELADQCLQQVCMLAPHSPFLEPIENFQSLRRT